MKKVNFLIIGGSGHLCELNHYPAILSMKNEGINTRVVAICDPEDPRSTNPGHYKVGRKNLNTVLSSDNPIWINPEKYEPTQLKHYLSQIAQKEDVDIVIIASNPSSHYFYSDWAVDEGINVLCDKPLVVVPDSSWKPEKAQLIEKRFRALYKKVEKAQKINPNYRFCTPLRRRALTPFMSVAKELTSAYEQTKEGITYINAVVNGGVHRYPAEFLKGGAHGFLDGIGSLSHSSYHYLDILAWYLQCAPGEVAKIDITLPHVSRVKDYIAKQGYSQLLRLNNEKTSVVTHGIKLPDRVLNAELDFTIHLHLYDKQNRKIGLISYTSNHTTFSPRTAKYDPDVLDHANDKNGGRMSQIYFDIHQGSIQNWSIIKNDAVFTKNHIETVQRLHPKLGKSHQKRKYTNAYNSQTITLEDLFVSFVKKSVGINVPEKHDEHLQLLNSQKLTHRIFSAAYELIAQDYTNPGNRDVIEIDMSKII
ncbi:Gfo/Idh/MocA family oxidoreductase [Candidatus Saccharibacteria bacterium]|nr:Gfo/Idh/MocA family oxidoreductase [Candidatus Saccharibacteria bacterium]